MLFMGFVVFGLVPTLVWALKAARGTGDALFAAFPVAAFLFGRVAVDLFVSGLVNLGVSVAIDVGCVVAIITIGGHFRDRAMKEALAAAENDVL